jgi:hypothetical protein
MTLWLATCDPLPEPDQDQPLLAALLPEASLAAWHDPSVDWRGTVILRSTWNYYRHSAAFLAWARSLPRVYNPLPVIEWNLHKRYLSALAAAGVPVVPTEILARGTSHELKQGSGVLKPAISAASYETHHFRSVAEGQAHIDRLLPLHDLLLQPYVPAMETVGERCSVWIDGELTHVVRKAPRYASGHEHITPVGAPTEGERDFVARVLAAAPGPLLYARVDSVVDAAGAPMLTELEILEPSLFLRHHPPAAQRLAAAIRRVARA